MTISHIAGEVHHVGVLDTRISALHTLKPDSSVLEHILSLHYRDRDRRMVDCSDCSGHYKRKMVDYYCKQSMKKVKELE